MAIQKSDYEEPRCPFKRPGSVTPIPTGRVIERLDEYLARNDYAAAEKHLRYWLAEAEAVGDERGKLTVRNEQIGLYRKMGRAEECRQAIHAALKLAEALELGDAVTMGTTLVNAATAHHALGEAAQALPLFRRAQAIYGKALPPGDSRLGGLYNNMALTLLALGEFRASEQCFHQAMDIMAGCEGGELEQAITHCNLADLAAAESGEEAGRAQIMAHLTAALALLDDPGLTRDGYYAFVCEKCAPCFGYYGLAESERELAQRARAIYERA